jgi:hypothetical protein
LFVGQVPWVIRMRIHAPVESSGIVGHLAGLRNGVASARSPSIVLVARFKIGGEGWAGLARHDSVNGRVPGRNHVLTGCHHLDGVGRRGAWRWIHDFGRATSLELPGAIHMVSERLQFSAAGILDVRFMRLHLYPS